ncbi:MAG TPA: FecR family protein, partial [Bryobacteraceae bacterium]|nr:FecR family protein [Bryobacteraceae bacterium]
QVSDGSTFEVYPNSRVVFRKNLFNWTDLLDLIVGRIRVHIEHLGGQPNPNRVLTPTAVISVRGTTFEVAVDDDGGTTEVDDVEGVVEVQHALLPRGDPVTLQTGESIRVYRDEPLAQSSIDKGALARAALRMMMNAVATMATRSAKIDLPGGGGPGAVGSNCKPGPGCSGTGTGTKPAPIPAPPPPPPPLP